jgi:hypothetical protein
MFFVCVCVHACVRAHPCAPLWVQDWEIDPQVFPTQWPGSQRRVWSYDAVNQYAWFKLYDECGGQGQPPPPHLLPAEGNSRLCSHVLSSVVMCYLVCSCVFAVCLAGLWSG